MEEKELPEKKVSQQHAQLPNDMTKGTDLTPKDLLIYMCIKKHQNKITKTCYPSLETIMKLSSSSKPTVLKAIDNLKRLNYINVAKVGRKNVYSFNSYKNFEMFSMEFLEKEDICATEKAIIIASQQYMHKDVDGYGKISYPDMKFADMINISYNTLTKYYKSLSEKGYLDIVRTSAKDSVTGIMINEKIFHLNDLEQAIVFKLQNHEDRIDTTERQVDILIKEVGRLNKIIEEQKTKVIM